MRATCPAHVTFLDLIIQIIFGGSTKCETQYAVFFSLLLLPPLWDSSVGIVTGYGLYGRGSIPGKGKIFLLSTESRPALGPTQFPIQWVAKGSFPGGKAVWP
jgi:hypothetical protein